jgi:Tol biopolymer transport system component
VRLTTAPADDQKPAWSPDGRYIAFLRGQDIYVTPALPGGVERKVGEGEFGVSWSPDSQMLAYVSPRAPASKEVGGIFLLSVETGERIRQVTTAVLPVSDQSPAFSPDGKSIAFLRYRDRDRAICVVPVTGGTPRQLLLDNRSIYGLTWTADSRELVFAMNRGGGRGLWRLPVEGGAPERIPITGQNPGSPVISRQGTRLAYSDIYLDKNVYLAEGPGFGGGSAPGQFGALKLLLASTREDHSPQFSPDGEKIVFGSQRTGSEELWVCQRDGSQLVKLTNFDSYALGTPRWSPDGRWIAFDSRGEIYVISATGGTPRNGTNAPSFEGMPSWSRDGRWIYSDSDRSGKRDIWKIPAAGGPAVQVTHDGAFEGFESPDGKLFYFMKGRGIYGLWSVPVEGGAEQPVPELNKAGYWRSWGVLKDGIYFISKEPAPHQTVRFFSFATRRITPLLAVDKEPNWYEPALSISPDGRWLLYEQLDHVINDILLVEHFS